MRRFAFYLSSEKYQNYSDTPHCHADAELLRNTLIDNCDYLAENSIIIKLEVGDGNNAELILSQISELVERADDGDSILFFFAGHGISIDSKTYLVLPDTARFNEQNTALKLSDVTYYLSKNKRLNIRIFDCCHSGEDSRSAETEMETQEFMRTVLSETSDCSVTLASCAAHQKSYWDDAIGNGIFTSSLVIAINEQKENSEIYVETLKIKVCDSVRSWCEARGKSQTPTLNAQISGNLPIARRRIPTKEIETAHTELPRRERLIAARNIEVVNETLYPELEQALKFIASEFEGFLKSDLYDISMKQTGFERSDNIPDFLKEKILDRMKSFKTMHVMEAIRTERPRLKSSFNSLLEYKQEYNTNYYITQKRGMPESFFTFESKTDGYLPSSAIFFYICPLQASIALVYGYYFDKAYNEAESDIRVRKLQHRIYSISEFRERKYCAEFPELKLAYHEDLEAEIDERLSLLEAESAILSKQN